ETALVLAYLLRARGDLSGAQAAAERAGQPALLRSILWERCDWKALARGAVPAGGEEGGGVGLPATHHHLTREGEQFDKVLKDVLASCPRPEAGQRKQLGFFSRASVLLEYGKPGEAAEAMRQDNHPETVYHFQCARLQFEEAFALVEQARNDRAS